MYLLLLADGSLAPASGQTVGEMGATGKVLTGNYVGTGQMGAIGGVLGATGPTTSPAGKAAIDRLQNQADREACNASGGFYTQGGACLSGQEAEDQVNKILNNPDAPDVLKQRAEAWQERNAGEPEDTDTGEDTSAISDEDAIASVLATVPEKLKGIITADNVIKVLEAGAGLNDPMTKIKKSMGAGVQFEWPGDWRNWKVFGPLAIPGVPLPPGIIDITIGEVIDAVGDLGGFISDPLGTLGKIGTTIKDTVEGVFGGSVTDPGWGGTLGGFEDWVKGVLGNVVGGAVLVDIYDDVKDVFTTETDTSVVPGGTETEENDTTNLRDVDDRDDTTQVFVDPSDPDLDDLDTRTVEDTVGGGFTYVDPFKDDTTGDVIGAGYFYGEDDDDVVITGGNVIDDKKDDDVVITGDDIIDDKKDDDVVITGGNVIDDRKDDDVVITGGNVIDDRKDDDVVITGGDLDIVEQPEDPVEIGGTPTPSSGGGGGGGGGGMFEPQTIGMPGMGDPALLAAQEFPVVNFLSEILAKQTKDELMNGMLTGRSIV